MSRLRLRVPSPALGVSIVALVVALGGTAAAFSLPNGSVGTPQLKNKAVTNAKLGPGSVGTFKIKDGAVTAPKINTTGLTVPNAINAVNASTLTSIQIVSGPNTTVPGNVPTGAGIAAQTVTCPTGKVAVSGNEVNGGGNTVSENEVFINGRNVTVFINNLGTAGVVWRAYAVCASGSSTGSSAVVHGAAGK